MRVRFTDGATQTTHTDYSQFAPLIATRINGGQRCETSLIGVRRSEPT